MYKKLISRFFVCGLAIGFFVGFHIIGVGVFGLYYSVENEIAMDYAVIEKGKEYKIIDKYSVDNQNFFILHREDRVSPTLVDRTTFENFFVNDTIVRLK
jgi:hypothetical protein